MRGKDVVACCVEVVEGGGWWEAVEWWGGGGACWGSSCMSGWKTRGDSVEKSVLGEYIR